MLNITIPFFVFLMKIHCLFIKKTKKNKIIEKYAIINDYINPKKSFLIRRKKKVIECDHNPCQSSLNCKKILAEECKNYHLYNNKYILDWYVKNQSKIFFYPLIHFNIRDILLSKIEYDLRNTYCKKYNIKSDNGHLLWLNHLKKNFNVYNDSLSFKDNINNLIIYAFLNIKLPLDVVKKICDDYNLIFNNNLIFNLSYKCIKKTYTKNIQDTKNIQHINNVGILFIL